MANPTDHMSGLNQTFDNMLASYPDYVCAIKMYNRHVGGDMTIRGILNIPRLNITLSNSEGHSTMLALEEFQKGWIDGKIDQGIGLLRGKETQVAKSIRDGLLNGLVTEANSAKVYVPSGNTIKFSIELFVDLYSPSVVTIHNINVERESSDKRDDTVKGDETYRSYTMSFSDSKDGAESYQKNIFALNSICAPWLQRGFTEVLTNQATSFKEVFGSGLAGVGSAVLGTVMNPGFTSPLMVPAIRMDLVDHFASGLLLNRDENRLASLVIGNWLCIKGGLWPTSTEVELVTNVSAEGTPLNAKFTIQLEYYKQPSPTTILDWFPKKPGSLASGSSKKVGVDYTKSTGDGIKDSIMKILNRSSGELKNSESKIETNLPKQPTSNEDTVT